MSSSSSATKLTVALITSILSLSSAACVAPMDGDEVEKDFATAEQPVVTSQCLNYQRDVVGFAADASIWEGTPGWNTGALTFLYTGTSPSGYKQSLLYFDISNVPAGAHIDSAAVTMYESWKAEGSWVNVHEILAPWDESTVTWNSFGGSYDTTPSTSFWAWGGGGHLQFHIEALVQAWVDGDSDNHGFLLDEAPENRTEFHSSEHSIVDDRPKLRICYTLDQ